MPQLPRFKAIALQTELIFRLLSYLSCKCKYQVTTLEWTDHRLAAMDSDINYGQTVVIDSEFNNVSV